MLTGRSCHLVRLRAKPARPVVSRVRDWMIAELTADVAAMGALYPSLDIDIAEQGETARHRLKRGDGMKAPVPSG